MPRELNFDWNAEKCDRCNLEYCLCIYKELAEENLNDIETLENVKTGMIKMCSHPHEIDVLNKLIEKQTIYSNDRKRTKREYKKLVFLTLNPDKENQNLKSIDKYIKKILKTKSILTYYYYYEWRNHDTTTNMYEGLHTHIILLGQTKKIIQHINRQKIPFFKDIKKYPVTYLQDKINYSSETFDPIKTLKKEKDKIARLYYNLLPMYTNTNGP